MPLGLGAISGIVQGGLGLVQSIAGLAKKKPKIPEYDIPEEVYQNMSDAEYASFIGLPETQKREFIDNTQRAGTQAMQQSTSRKGGMGMVAGIQQQQADDYKSLLSADAGARRENIRDFWSMRNVMASEKSKKQEWKRDAVMTERDEINQMRGAGLQNMMGAMGTMAGLDMNDAIGTFGKSNKTLPVDAEPTAMSRGTLGAVANSRFALNDN